MGIAIIAKGADFSDNNIGTVTPFTDVQLSSISIDGPDTVVGTQAVFDIEYSPSNTTHRGVTWSITSGGQYATINSQGKLTVLGGASSASVTIQATSTYNQLITATKTITVTYNVEYDLEALIGFNDFSKKRSKFPNFPTGWAYPLMNAGQQYVGGTVTAALDTSATGSCPYFFKIPIPENSVSVNLPVMKSTSGYGYGFCDNSEILLSTYINTTIDSGTYNDITIPTGATYVIMPLAQSIYTNSSVFNNMKVTFS